MNDTTPAWEGEMASEFDRRVRDLHEAPLTLDHVRGRATTIRRTRRAVVAGAVLAAAAVVVPVAVTAADGPGRDRGSEIPPATSSSSPTADRSAVPAYVEGTSYHRTDGSVLELPSAAYEWAAALGDRLVATSRDDEGFLTLDVIEDGRVVDSYAAASEPVASETGATVAFVTTDGVVQSIWDDGERALAEDRDGWSVRAVTGGPACLDAEDPESRCRVYLKDDGADGRATAIDSYGIDEPPVPDAVVISDADGEGLLAVTSEVTDGGSCGGVYDETTAAYLFEQCEFRVLRFAPDGRHVLGGPAYADGLGDSYAVVLDATTGDEVARLEPADGFVGTTTWVDDTTIAAQVFDYGDQTWSIQTLALGADRPVTVVGPQPGADTEAPFRLLR